MSQPLAMHPRAGRIEPRRLGVRHAIASPNAEACVETHAVAGADELNPGLYLVGPMTIEARLARNQDGTGCALTWRIANVSDMPVAVDAVLLGARWCGRPPGHVRYLRHGWQSWSFSGFRTLDEVGEPAFPGPSWIRGMHHAVGDRPGDRARWHESATVTVAGVGARGPACLAGAMEHGHGFAIVYLRQAKDDDAGATGAGDTGADIEIELEIRLEVALEPGESRTLESLWFALGEDDTGLLEEFATRWGRVAGARTKAPFVTGWCSWYHYFHRVTEADVLRNLDALQAARADIPTQVVQLDDGYQRAVGDWLDTGPGFPRGLASLANDIRSAGFRAGLWTAPLCAVPESQFFADHRDWLLQHRDRPFPALFQGNWSARGWVHALDPSRPEVLAHLREVFAALVAMGWDYLKLDFLFVAAMRADASDASMTRAWRLKRALEAIRDGAGEDAYLLGCGSPLGPAVGICDAMRIGPDVAPHWDVREAHAPGLERVMPGTANAIRGVVHRLWTHRRLWVADPDCLMVRSRDTELSASEMRALAAVIAATGGLVVFSDDVAALGPDERARIREVVALARMVDENWSHGGARVLGWRDPRGDAQTIEAGCAPGTGNGPEQTLVVLLNTGDEPVERNLARLAGLAELAELAPEPVLGSAALEGDDVVVVLGPRDAASYRLGPS